MKAEAVGRKAIQVVNETVNYAVLTIIVLLTAFAVYSLWDSKQIYAAAVKGHYEVYKPSVIDEGKSFLELRAINPEVIAWLTVFGTNIDYPVTRGDDNMKYVNTNAEGSYSLSGSIFLDERNSKDFSDFNNILYGHHMEKKAMFGDIGEFSGKEMFDSRLYGNLYFEGRDHGIEFFAFVHADAYDRKLFVPIGEYDETEQEYLDALLEQATHKRDIGITKNDHIILLSTCSSSSTNGRDILAGRITDKVFDDPFASIKAVKGYNPDGPNKLPGFIDGFSMWQLLIMIAVAVWLIVKLIRVNRRLKKNDTGDRKGIMKWLL